MNLIEIAGHLGADAETRFTASGLKVTTLRVATNLRRKDKEETIWWRVTIWGDRFDKLLPYLKKGTPIIVVGELNKPEIYTDKNGNQQVALDITAEIIRFSPFGRPDKGEQQQQTTGHVKTGSSAAHPHDFSDSGVTMGQSAQKSYVEEEPLPF